MFFGALRWLGLHDWQAGRLPYKYSPLSNETMRRSARQRDWNCVGEYCADVGSAESPQQRGVHALGNPEVWLIVERIGQIRLPEACANVCFGGPKRNRLFMTASQSIYAVYVNTRGAHVS